MTVPPGAGAGLYVHVPFCARACPYCDFDIEVGRVPATERWLAALESELTARAIVGPFSTVYVGGGTPSLVGGPEIVRLLDLLERRLGPVGGDEITVEVNPEHADQDLLRALVDRGVHRVSLGVQTLAAAGLRELGRVHDAAMARGAIERAVALGLRVAADLIVGHASQTPASLAADLRGIVEAGAEHVSVYALTIEAGTPWEGLVRRGRRAEPDEDAQADALLAAAAALARAGFRHYEISSHARPGAQARHNVGYWTFRDYVGLGPSAASARFGPDGGVVRERNPRGLAAWAEAWRPGGPGPAEVERLDGERAAAEGLWTGLRLLEGIDLSAFLTRFPAVDRAWIVQRTRRQVELGNLMLDPGRLAVAPSRWLFLDALALDLLP